MIKIIKINFNECRVFIPYPYVQKKYFIAFALLYATIVPVCLKKFYFFQKNAGKISLF